MKFKKSIAAGLVCILFSPLPALAVNSNDYPVKPISIVVPFPPAGPTDALARTLAAEMQKALSQPVIIDNKPGAAGNIGASYVAQAKADGYTLLFASSGPLLINTSLFNNPGFDPLKDFSPIAYIGEIPNVMVVSPNNPSKTVGEFVAFAKKERVSYGSSGNGSTNHLAAAKFSKETGTDMLHVPYRGTSPAVTDLMGGHVSMMYLDVLTALPFIKSGKLHALAVASPNRSRVLPEVETFRDQGVATLERGVAFGLLAPANIPDNVRTVLAKAVTSAIHSEKMQASMAAQGVEAGSINTPEDFGAYIEKEVAAWRDVVELAGAKID